MVVDLNVHELNDLLKAMEAVRTRSIKSTTKFKAKYGDSYIEKPETKRSMDLLIAKLEKAHMDYMLKMYEGYNVG